MISVQEAAQSGHSLTKLICLRKHYDAEMIGFGPIETASGNYQNICSAKQIACELFVIGNAEFLYIQFGEQIESGFVFDIGNSIDIIQCLYSGFALLKGRTVEAGVSISSRAAGITN